MTKVVSRKSKCRAVSDTRLNTPVHMPSLQDVTRLGHLIARLRRRLFDPLGDLQLRVTLWHLRVMQPVDISCGIESHHFGNAASAQFTEGATENFAEFQCGLSVGT